jgi:hypothetical protein
MQKRRFPARAAAIGVAPSKDNFRSSSVPQMNGEREANPLIQSLTCGLSCGPVGPSDQIGKMDFSNVHHICRGPDGFLNKPTLPATPLDLTFKLGFDDYTQGLDSLPFVQHAYSEISTAATGLRWHYLFAVDLATPVVVELGDLGLPAGSKHIAFEYFAECWRNATAVEHGNCIFELGAGHTTKFDAANPLTLQTGGVRGDGLGPPGSPDPQARPFRYVLTAPLLSSGWVLLGETGKYFTATADRFSNLTGPADVFNGVPSGAGGHVLGVQVHGAKNERVTIELIPPAAADRMRADDSGRISTVIVHCQLSPQGSAELCCTQDESCACAFVGSVADPDFRRPSKRTDMKGKTHRVDPDFGSTLTVSNRDSQSNCWVNWKIMGQPCECQV